MATIIRILRKLRQPPTPLQNNDPIDYPTALAEGNRYLSEGDLALAVQHYRQAIELDSQAVDAHVSLGYALKELGDWPAAATAFEAALDREPGNADSSYFLGCMSLATGRPEIAIRQLQTALVHNPLLEPAYPEAALSLFRLGRTNDALALLSRGIGLLPHSAALRFAMGNVLAETSMFREAVEAYEQVLQLSPKFAEALANLGNCERHLGLTDLALEHIDAALTLQPDNAGWHSNRLFTLQYAGKLDQAGLFREHLRFAERFEAPLKARWPRATSPFTGERRLRLGYVSGDLRQHSLSFFFEPVLRHHDRSSVEVFCYYTYPVSDAATQRMHDLSDHWCDCADLSDDSLAQKISDDGIDVLIDLSGHTGHNRLPVFARKPAPVQMTWLGYQATTGLTAIDYRITDVGMDPPGQTERYHTEKLLRLSTGAVFQPDPISPDVTELPCISAGVFTFACLNNPAKITPEFIATVAAILRDSLSTRILLGNAGVATGPMLTDCFAQHGISADRLVLVDKMNMPDYLRLHGKIDLALDTFPYNGGTTTMHSLWMGVPVLALDGSASISRVGVQMMRGLGLDRFACSTVAEYIKRAIELSQSTSWMQQTRAGLRTRMAATMVKQAQGFTSELEHAILLARKNAV